MNRKRKRIEEGGGGKEGGKKRREGLGRRKKRGGEGGFQKGEYKDININIIKVGRVGGNKRGLID